MKAEELDALLLKWLRKQPAHLEDYHHIQIKFSAVEVEMAQLAHFHLPGWVILDWQPRGLGLSAKRAVAQPPSPARMLEGLAVSPLSVHIQIVQAPPVDWADAAQPDSLAPDLLPVLDGGRARVLKVTAIRREDVWLVQRASEPPAEEPITL